MLPFLLSAGFVALAVGMAVSLVAILFRHAVPKAPTLFHLLCVVPMTLAIIVSLVLAWMALNGAASFWGVRLDVYRLTLVLSIASTFWALNGYSYYYHVRGKYR
jgi:flagellar biosynthesis component FlhA